MEPGVMSKIILSLFDYTGNWPKPWIEAGYTIYTHDLKCPASEYLYPERIHIQGDIRSFNYKDMPRPDAILAAPDCTHFSLSGAKHFAQKDADGRTADSVILVQKALEIINYWNPRVWALENPMSRIHKLVPELGAPLLKFQPWEYGGLVSPPETYWKQTWLWGRFELPSKSPVTPMEKDHNGLTAWYNSVGGKSDKTKEHRSKTPMGFAKAFAVANWS